jgi:uncharacterized protein
MSRLEPDGRSSVSGASRKPPRSRLRRWVRRTIRVAVIAYVAVCLILYFFQNALIFPGAYVHDRESATVHAAPGREILHLHAADGRDVAAVFGNALDAVGTPRADAASRPTILFFYGNGDCIKTSMELFDELRRLGANVLIPEYEGYPMSGGKLSEAGIHATANAAYAYLLTRHDVDPKRIVLIGRSLGGAPAIDLASREPVAGLITVSAFTTMDEMARKVVPFIPTSLALKVHFNNEEKIAQVKCPILLVHGTHDTFVPFSMMGRLAAKARAPVTQYPVRGGDHNDIFLVGGQELMAKIGKFVNSTSQSSSD